MTKKVGKIKYEFDKAPIECDLKNLQPLRFVIVSKTPLEAVWDYAVSEYHYLGYNKMIGPRLKYMVFSGSTILAALSFSQASYRVGSRDRFIGWDDELRMQSLQLVINNNRFLILPWVKVKNLASHILSLSIKLLRSDWFNHWQAEPVMIETFVDSVKYEGTCYKAANWIYLGETQGYARKGGLYTYHGNRKGVYVYPLKRDFRKIIGCTDHPQVRTLNLEEERRVEKMLLHNNEWNPELMEEAGITTDEVENIGRLMFEYHDSFRDCYTHKNQIVFGETYLMGLMSNLDRKSVEPISLQYLDVNDVRGFQRFFKDSPWNFKKMKDIYQMRLSSLITDPDAMLTLDPSDFPKKGKESAGVARQHCGALGKTDNCQCGVFIGYTSTKGYGLVDSKLYMPEKWFGDEYKDRRDNCAVPKDLKFETKIEIAQELIKDIKDKGYFPSKWLGCDSFFGRNAAFLDSIADDFWYFADVLSNMLVFTIDTKTEPYEYSGRGRPPRKELKPSIKPISVSSIAKDDSIPWNTVILGEGAKGPIIAEIKCLRVFELRDGLPEREIWLYIRKSEDGKIKYSLSNAPDDTPLKDLNRASLMRWPIEQCFEECKSNLGMDHYEIRSYPGWHRHMLFVFLAQLFLLELRFKFKKKSYFNSFDDKKACSSSIDIKDS